ncbi:MAG: polysaccharide pyruvyl transferase family protein [Planctomycetota bacterium]|jgi:polysaccharide pyruvyl transferase WcaK-like protein
MNVLFASPGYGIRSVGDDAMLVAIKDALEKRGEARTAVAMRHQFRQLEHYEKLGFSWGVQNFDHNTREQSLGRRFLGFNLHDVTPSPGLRGEFFDADVLVLGGGEVFLDITHGRWRGPVAYYELLVTLARFMGVPIVLAGASLPVLTNEACKESVRFIFDNCDRVILRDSISVKNARDLGYEGDITVLPDPAMGLEARPLDGELYASLFHRHMEAGFWPQKVPRIAVALRHLYWTESDFDAECESWAKVCDVLVDELDADIIFIPHNLYGVDDERLDDRHLASCVMEKMEWKSSAQSLTEYNDPREILSAYEAMDLVIAMRHHGVVFGARANVPTIAVPYSEKTIGFVKDAREYTEGIECAQLGAVVDTAKRLLGAKVDTSKLTEQCSGYVDAIVEAAR